MKILSVICIWFMAFHGQVFPVEPGTQSSLPRFPDRRKIFSGMSILPDHDPIFIPSFWSLWISKNVCNKVQQCLLRAQIPISKCLNPMVVMHITIMAMFFQYVWCAWPWQQKTLLQQTQNKTRKGLNLAWKYPNWQQSAAGQFRFHEWKMVHFWWTEMYQHLEQVGGHKFT